MKKLLVCLLAAFAMISCTQEPKVMKKEKVSMYEVTDMFGEMKQKETPTLVIVREFLQNTNINKVSIYEGGGTLVYTENYTYDANGTPVKSYKSMMDFLTEEEILEDGQWFKVSQGNKSLLPKDHKIKGYEFYDYVVIKEDGSAEFIEPIMGAEFKGEITEKDKNGNWIKYTANTVLDTTPQMVIQREIVEVWE